MKKILALLLTLIFALSFLIPADAVMAAELENLALGKPVTATSEYSAYYNMPAVNDGKMSTAWSEGAVRLAPDDDEGRSWIQIDLGGRYDITSMIAYSRSDVNSASERMGWYYQVAESSDFSDGVTIGVKSAPGQPGQGYEVSLRKPVTGRYVRVACKEYFVIAEIEVYGTPAAEKAKGEYDDIEPEGRIYNASQLAYYLNIMEGIGSKEFGYGYVMTRGEAAEAAARLQGSGELDPTATIYEDVPTDHEKSGYIAWCEKAGIVSRGTSYRPDDYITGIEFLTMLLRLNGWYCLAQDGQYPGNIITTAQKIKLTKGVDIDVKDNLNKSRAILLIYNMLTSDMANPIIVNNKAIGYTAGDTYLEEVFDLALYEGVVEESAQTGLVEAVGAGDKHATIDAVRYKDKSGRASEFLGESVYYLSDKDNNLVHLWRNPMIGTRTTIMCKDVERSGSGSISYYDEKTDSVRSAKLASPVNFIKNGAASSNFSLNKLNPANGKLVLIDNDLDGKIEVIKLYEPQVLVVDYIGVDGYRLAIGGQNGDTLDVPDFDELLISRNGFPLNIGDIPTDALVYAYVSDNGKHVELDVSFESVTGTITSLSKDEVTIDGVTYSYSEYYTENAAVKDNIRVGTEVTFLLDENGLIVWAINDSITSTSEVLSVILAVSKPEGLEPVQICVYNEQNEMLTLNFANNAKVDGVKMGTSQIEALGTAYFEGKAAIYRLNSAGLITYLNTENRGANEPEDKLMLHEEWTLPSGSGRSAMGFYNNYHEMVLPVYENFPVFVLGKDANGDYIYDASLKNKFSYKGINSVCSPDGDNYSKGDYKFYGDADDKSPAFGVCFQTINTDAYYETLTKYTSNNTLVVDTLAEYLGADGEMTYRIYGYNAATGASIKYVVRSDITAVVDSYSIYIAFKKKGYAMPRGISANTLNYINPNSSDEEVMRSVTFPVSELKRGDVLRYELSNEQIGVLERIYNADGTYYGTEEKTKIVDGASKTIDIFTELITEPYKGLIATTGDNNGARHRAGYRAFCGTVDKLENGILELDLGERKVKDDNGNETGEVVKISEKFSYKNTDIKSIIVVDNDDTIKTYAADFMPMHVAIGDRVFVVSLSGKASYMVVYK